MLAGVSASSRCMMLGSTAGRSLSLKGKSAAIITTRRMLVSFQGWRAIGRGCGGRGATSLFVSAMEGKNAGCSRADAVHDQTE